MSEQDRRAYLAEQRVEEVLIAAVARVLEDRPAEPIRALGDILCKHSKTDDEDEEFEAELRQGDWASNRAACTRVGPSQLASLPPHLFRRSCDFFSEHPGCGTPRVRVGRR